MAFGSETRPPQLGHSAENRVTKQPPKYSFKGKQTVRIASFQNPLRCNLSNLSLRIRDPNYPKAVPTNSLQTAHCPAYLSKHMIHDVLGRFPAPRLFLLFPRNFKSNQTPRGLNSRRNKNSSISQENRNNQSEKQSAAVCPHWFRE